MKSRYYSETIIDRGKEIRISYDRGTERISIKPRGAFSAVFDWPEEKERAAELLGLETVESFMQKALEQ